MFLPDTTFREVIAAVPLVSIDLVIDDGAGRFLMGQRIHRPAKGSWFVPGGRVRKNERLDDAFGRLCRSELGHDGSRSTARWLGIYEHFYPDSVFGMVGDAPDTHYIALAYRLTLGTVGTDTMPTDQHRQWRWWPADQALLDAEVHAMSKTYIVDAIDKLLPPVGC